MRSRNVILAMSAIALVFASAACSKDGSDPTTDRERDTARINLQNDLEGGVQFEHVVADGLTVVTSYVTNGYSASDWRVTDSKSVTISAQVDASPRFADAEVLIEHMHADVFINAEREMMDGITQDRMDDGIHGGTQPGFAIGGPNDYTYSEIFSIEGYSDTFISGYGWYMDGYGHSSLEEHRPTENRLIEDDKVTGNKFQVVFDVLIRMPGEANYHKVVFADEFIVEVV